MKFHRIKTKLKKEDFFKILLVLVWTRTILTSYVYQTLLRIPLIGDLALEIKYFVYILAILFALPALCKQLKISDYLFGLACLILYFINLNIFPKTHDYLITNGVSILCVSAAAYYIGVSLNKDEYITLLYKWSKVCIYMMLLYFFVIGFHSEEGREVSENMGMAYRLLPHLVLVLLYFLKYRKKNDLVATIIGTFLLLACGTRGPFIAVLIFVAVYIAFFMELKRKWIFISIFGILAILLTVSPGILLSPLTGIMDKLGLSTRIIDAFVSGNLNDDNGRNEIAFTMINLLKQNNYHGFGLAGDRGIVSWMAYSHNIVIVLMMTFGAAAGLLIFGLVVFIVVKALVLSNMVEREFIVSLIFGGSLFKLFLQQVF